MKCNKTTAQVIILTCLTIYLPSYLGAQGVLLNNGDSGLAVQGSISRVAGFTGISTDLGYSLAGIIDLGLSLSRESGTQRLFDGLIEFDVSGLSVGPSLGVHFLKNDKPAAISLAGHLGYSHTFVTIEQPEDESFELGAFAVGLSSYTRHPLTASMKLILSVLGAYVRSERSGLTGHRWESDLDCGLDAGLTFDLSKRSMAYLAPGYYLVAGESRLTLSVGYLFR